MNRVLTHLLVAALFFALGWFAHRQSSDGSVSSGIRSLFGSHEREGRIQSLQQLRQLATAVHEYAASHNGNFPKTFDELFIANAKLDKAILHSPLSADTTRPSYELVPPAPQIQQIPNPTITIMIRALYTTKDGKRLAAFCDGHVEFLPE